MRLSHCSRQTLGTDAPPQFHVPFRPQACTVVGLADSPLAEECRPAGLQQHCHRAEKKNRTGDNQSHCGSDDVKYSLSMPNVERRPNAGRVSSDAVLGLFRRSDVETRVHSLLRWDPVQLWNTTHRRRLLFVPSRHPIASHGVNVLPYLRNLMEMSCRASTT